MRKFSLILLACLMSLTMLSSSSYADEVDWTKSLIYQGNNVESGYIQNLFDGDISTTYLARKPAGQYWTSIHEITLSEPVEADKVSFYLINTPPISSRLDVVLEITLYDDTGSTLRITPPDDNVPILVTEKITSDTPVKRISIGTLCNGNTSACYNDSYSFLIGEIGLFGVSDITPPDVPAGLTGVPGSTEVELSWTANTEDDLAGYNVYVDDDQVNSDLVTDANYTVTGLTPDTEYSFAVSAVDTSNNESERSAAILITTLDTPPPPPAAPGDVTTTPGPGRVTISWDPVDGAIGYNVYVDGVQANTDLITGTSYTITGLDPDTEYNFTVTAVGAGGESDTSDPAPSVPDQDNSLDLSGITPIATIGAVIGTAISWITNVIPGWVLLGLGIIFAVVLVRFLFWIVQKIKAETKFKQGKALSTKEYDRLSKEDKDRYTLRALERQDKTLRGANYDKITNDLRTKVDRHDRDRVSRMSTKEFDDKHGRAARQGMYDYLTAKGRIKERDDWVRNTGSWGIRQREGRAGRAGRASRPGRDSSR